MKRWLPLLLPLMLAGCLEDKAPTCYEVANVTSQPSPILLNKCTGDTYIMLKNNHPDGSYTWAWYKVGRIDSVNFVDGK